MPTRIAMIGFQHFRIFEIVTRLLNIGHVELVALAEANAGLRNEMARRFAVPAYADYRDLIAAERPDAAALGTINSEKAEVIIACAKAGVHVIFDKPLCTEFDQLDRIERTLRSSPVRLTENMAGGYGGSSHALRQVIRDHLGKVVQLDFASVHRWRIDPMLGYRPPWNYTRTEFGGSIVVDAINNLNMVRWLTEQDVLAVTAIHANHTMPEHPEFQDNFVVLAELEESATAALSFSWLTPDAEPTHGRSSMFIVGTKGLLEVRSRVPEPKESDPDAREIHLAQTETLLTTGALPVHRVVMPKVAAPNHQEDFIAAVRDPAYVPMLSTAWILESARVALAARQSADEHRTIRLDEVLRSHDGF